MTQLSDMRGRLLAVVLALWLALLAVPPANSAPPPVVFITEFRNNTGDPAWDTLSRGLADMFRSDLDDSAALRIVERAELDAILAEQALVETGVIDLATAVQVGKGVAATHVFFGAFIVSGDQLRIDARLVSVETSEQVLSEKVVGDKDDFFGLEAQLIGQLHVALQVPQPSLQKVQLSRRAPAPLSALLTYSEALAQLDLGQHEAALALLQQTIDAAPEFELAYARVDEIEAALNALMAARQAGLSGAALDAAQALQDYTPAACDTFRQVYKAMLSDLDEARELNKTPEDLGTRLYRTYAVLRFVQDLGLPDDPCGLVPPNDAVVALFLTQGLEPVLCSESTDEALATCVADALPMRGDDGRVALAPDAYEELYLELALDYLARFPYGSKAQDVGRRAEAVARNQRLRSTTFEEGAGRVLAQFGVKMVPVNPAHFQLGAEPDGRQVWVRAPFLIADVEVTQDLYEAVARENNSQFKEPGLPVHLVSVHDAMLFCNLLSELEGLTPAYWVKAKDPETGEWMKAPLSRELRAWASAAYWKLGADGYRLPRRSEWELAARAGGDWVPEDLETAGWHGGNSKERPQPVRGLPPNPLGLYDMAGNMSELTWDTVTTRNTGQINRGGSHTYRHKDRELLKDFHRQHGAVSLGGGGWNSHVSRTDPRIALLVVGREDVYNDVGFRVVRSLGWVEHTMTLTDVHFNEYGGRSPGGGYPQFRYRSGSLEDVKRILAYERIRARLMNCGAKVRWEDPTWSGQVEVRVGAWNLDDPAETLVIADERTGDVIESCIQQAVEDMRIWGHSGLEGLVGFHLAYDQELHLFDDATDPAWQHGGLPPEAFAAVRAERLAELQAADRGRLALEPVPGKVVDAQGYGGVEVPAGMFTMGRRGDTDSPPHKVTLTTPLWVGETEVTQALFEEVAGSERSLRNPSKVRGPDLPVTGLTFLQAATFCNRLSLMEGLSPAYRIETELVGRLPGADGYRLPTEAEWEYFALAGKDTRYAGSDKLDTVANCGKQADGTLPVAQREPNAWGLYDLSGNAYEWTEDHPCELSTEPATDPVCDSGPWVRVTRGGNWYSEAEFCEVRTRRPDTIRWYSGGEMVRTELKWRETAGLRIVRPLADQ